MGKIGVQFLTKDLNISTSNAVIIGNKLLNASLMEHVTHEHVFCAGRRFYRLTGLTPENSSSRIASGEDGSNISMYDTLLGYNNQRNSSSLLSSADNSATASINASTGMHPTHTSMTKENIPKHIVRLIRRYRSKCDERSTEIKSLKRQFDLLVKYTSSLRDEDKLDVKVEQNMFVWIIFSQVVLIITGVLYYNTWYRTTVGCGVMYSMLMLYYILLRLQDFMTNGIDGEDEDQVKELMSRYKRNPSNPRKYSIERRNSKESISVSSIPDSPVVSTSGATGYRTNSPGLMSASPRSAGDRITPPHRRQIYEGPGHDIEEDSDECECE